METDQTLSVSKGVFIFKNNFKAKTKNKHRKKPTDTRHANTLFSSNNWYEHYSSLWDVIEEGIDTINDNMFSLVLGNLINFVKNSRQDSVNEIPTAALFTGINMPDHGAQFAALSRQLKETTPHVICLESQDCQNIKYLMENMINQFVNDDEDDSCETEQTHIKKTQLSMALLQCWYKSLYKDSVKKPLTVIIPDFESFNPIILQRFILIISCYLKELPFVLIFGIATDMNALHSSLPYKVSSKIRVKVFNSERSIEYLNNVLEKVFFSDFCAFRLGGKVFNLFMELFLFYDLSVSNFIENIRYACADHFTFGNAMTLCHFSQDVNYETLVQMSHEDFENIRQLASFKKLIQSESKEVQVKLLVDDDYFSEILSRKICDLQLYIKLFHSCLRCLLVLVEDLPRAPLGKQVRELYAIAAVKNITQTADYNECMKLLNFQSKDELSFKLIKIISILTNQEKELPRNHDLKQFIKKLSTYLNSLISIESNEFEESMEEDTETTVELKVASRGQFRQKLLENTKQPNKSLNKYEKLRAEIIKTISATFEKYLVEPESQYFHEIFFYNNMAIKNYIIGSHRAAIHNALNDPQFYLQCECCKLATPTSINPTLPDICIAYKLHLEYGKMINLYDWLQSFLSIVDPEINTQLSTKIVVKPELQARFTQAVTELEQLGFIKSSKRKTDHVQRLTWGG